MHECRRLGRFFCHRRGGWFGDGFDRRGIGLARVDPERGPCLDQLIGRRLAGLGQPDKGGVGDVLGTDLEVGSERVAGVRAAEAVGAQDDVGAVDPAGNGIGHGFHVVRGGDDRSRRIGQLPDDVGDPPLVLRVEPVMAVHAQAIGPQLLERGRAPHVGRHAEPLGQDVRRPERLVEDGTGAEDLDPAALTGRRPESVQPAEDALRHALGHRAAGSSSRCTG